MNYDVCVVGLGYIGLPTASIFATRGKRVLGVDIVGRIVDTINSGEIHIAEPDLDVLVRAAVHRGSLGAALSPQPAAAYVIAVPTPFCDGASGGKSPDLSFVESAARSIAPHVGEGGLVILESTSPVGTTEAVRGWLFDELRLVRPGDLGKLSATVMFAHCPERILPGRMLKELVENDRVCGGLTPEAAAAAAELYRAFCTAEIFQTDARTAELCKLTENASRDVGIAFANELALICDRLDVDVWELIRLANRHPRVNILSPGPGVGGHCIAVDPWFIVDAAPDLAKLIRTARQVNDDRPHDIVSRIKASAEKFKNPVIACLGLTFKANVDDIRESPALQIVRLLRSCRAGRIIAVEPRVSDLTALLNDDGIEVKSADAAIAESDIVVMLVDHREFYRISKKRLAGKVVIDTRGVWK